MKRLLKYLGTVLIIVTFKSYAQIPQDSVAENPFKKKKSEIHFPGTFSVQTDQDYFFHFPASKNEDRNYTQGTSLIYSHHKLMKTWLFYPLRIISNRTRPKQTYSSSLALAATGFTPRIIDSVAPIVGDRPFAFLLYLSTSSTFENQKTAKLSVYNTFTINYGVLGTNVGYAFQGWAHKHIVKGRPTDPKGWKTQISKGGAPALLFEYNRFRPLFGSGPKGTVDDRSVFDLGWNLGGSLGYYDRVFTGLYTRLGHLRNKNQPRWNGGWSSLTSGSYQMDKPRSRSSKFLNVLEAFVYGKANTSLMFRNSMLVGQVFGKDIYTLKPDWTKVWLYEFEWGGIIAFEHATKKSKLSGPRTIAVMYRNVYRSPEFDSGIFPVRLHYFGSIGLMFPFFK